MRAQGCACHRTHVPGHRGGGRSAGYRYKTLPPGPRHPPVPPSQPPCRTLLLRQCVTLELHLPHDPVRKALYRDRHDDAKASCLPVGAGVRLQSCGGGGPGRAGGMQPYCSVRPYRSIVNGTYAGSPLHDLLTSLGTAPATCYTLATIDRSESRRSTAVPRATARITGINPAWLLRERWH